MCATTHEAVSVGGGIAVGVTGTASRTEATTLPPLDIDSCAEIKELANGRFKGPVIVCIDEIQDIQKNTRAAEFVRELHTQFDAPVLLVCAGLSNSERRLRDVGLSQRLSRRHVVQLGLLQPEEALEAAQESLKVIAKTAGVSANELVDMFAKDIAVASDNWPRHLTCYLHGVCEALDKQDRPSLRWKRSSPNAKRKSVFGVSDRTRRSSARHIEFLSHTQPRRDHVYRKEDCPRA